VTATGTALLKSVADLAILATAIGILLYVISRGILRSGILPSRGRQLLVAGLSLIVSVHLADLVLLAWQSSGSGITNPGLADSALPDGVHWLLSRTAFLMVVVGLLLAFLQRRRTEARQSRQDELARSARDSMLESEARFRHLMETTSNAVFCYRFEPPVPLPLGADEIAQRLSAAILAECNVTFAADAFDEPPSDAIGKRYGDLERDRDRAAQRRFAEALVANDFRLTNYEHTYIDPGGRERAVQVSVSGVVRDAALCRIWGAETDTTEIRRTQAALERRHDFQELLARVSSQLVVRRDREAEGIIRAGLAEICQFVGAERTTLVWIDWTRRKGDISYAWASEPGSVPTQEIRTADYPQLTRALVNAEVTRIDDVDAMPENMAQDRASLQALGLKAFVSLPMTIAGDVVGVMTFSNTATARKWTDQDILDLRVFAELFANYILRLRSRRELDVALESLRAATDRLEAENVYLREEIQSSHDFDYVIGESEVLLRCLQQVRKVADTSTPVLILGETGTGKELIARAIHERSPRRDRALVKVNCAALPAELIESELFGYEKGAFTGAQGSKRGRFDLADGSTLLLDEIGELPLDLQAKLLRVLQEGEFERLGGTKTCRVDVRIIAATNRDLGSAVEQGQFRSDLYYRINTFPVELPPLRARGDDIRLLTEHFVQLHAQQLGRQVDAVSAEMMRQLVAYSWPGNVRELEGVIQRSIISSSDPVLELADPLVGPRTQEPRDAPRVIGGNVADLRRVEREHIMAVLEETGWKISGESGAASKLGIPPSTLRSKMKKLSIERPH